MEMVTDSLNAGPLAIYKKSTMLQGDRACACVCV